MYMLVKEQNAVWMVDIANTKAYKVFDCLFDQWGNQVISHKIDEKQLKIWTILNNKGTQERKLMHVTIGKAPKAWLKKLAL
jgi:hypothetical protein